MSIEPSITADRDTITVHVPLKFRSKGCTKRIVAPEVIQEREDNPDPNATLLKALARAFRWRKLLEDGQYATLKELAHAEKINESYVSRILRLTLLAPCLVDEILDGRQADDLTMQAISQPFSSSWDIQKAQFGHCESR